MRLRTVNEMTAGGGGVALRRLFAARLRICRPCPGSSEEGWKADAGNRTPDLLITSEPLCHLSYVGLKTGASCRKTRPRSGSALV
jgi:hypothetical protein